MQLNSVTGLTGVRHLKTPLLDLQRYTTGLKRTAFRTFMYVLKQQATMVLLSLLFCTKRI